MQIKENTVELNDTDNIMSVKGLTSRLSFHSAIELGTSYVGVREFTGERTIL